MFQRFEKYATLSTAWLGALVVQANEEIVERRDTAFLVFRVACLVAR